MVLFSFISRGEIANDTFFRYAFQRSPNLQDIGLSEF